MRSSADGDVCGDDEVTKERSIALQDVINAIEWFATNKVILGLATIAGLISFVLSIVVSVRTAKIGKILKYNNLADSFNKERKALWRTAMGHRDSILKDDMKTDVTRSNILIFVNRCHNQYKPLMNWKVGWSIWRLQTILKQKNAMVDYNAVVNHLAELVAWLETEEERKNG